MKHNAAADILSRYAGVMSFSSEVDEDRNEDAAAALTETIVAPLDLGRWAALDEETVLLAALEDPGYHMLGLNMTNWNRSQDVAYLRFFYSVSDILTVPRGHVTYILDQGGVQLVIPEALRQRVAFNLRTSHQGRRCICRAKWATCDTTELAQR